MLNPFENKGFTGSWNMLDFDHQHSLTYKKLRCSKEKRLVWIVVTNGLNCLEVITKVIPK